MIIPISLLLALYFICVIVFLGKKEIISFFNLWKSSMKKVLFALLATACLSSNAIAGQKGCWNGSVFNNTLNRDTGEVFRHDGKVIPFKDSLVFGKEIRVDADHIKASGETFTKVSCPK